MNTYWSIPPIPSAGKLQGKRVTDACIVGAGIAGMSTAYMLTKAGLSVILLEAGDIACGETQRSTAHLSSALDDGFCHLERMFGTDGSRLAVQSHIDAISKIETICAQEHIDCGFKRLDGYLFNPAQGGVDIDAEYAAALRMGLEADIVHEMPFAEKVGKAIRFKDQAVFHPTRYIEGLSRIIGHQNIYTQSRVIDISKGDTFILHTEEGQVETPIAIMATHTPFIDDGIATKNMAYRSYVVCIKMPRSNFQDALYWDTLDPYHHCRICPIDDKWDILMVGGGDHRTGHQGSAADIRARFNELEKWARLHVPNLQEVTHRWSGQVMEPVDGLAFLGRPHPEKHPGLYVITGESGHGLTHATIGATMITDMILGRQTPLMDIYAPDRGIHQQCREWLAYNAHFAKGLLQHLWPSKQHLHDIPIDSGAILQNGIGKKAVYRDIEGQYHNFSAKCPHMCGLLTWNDFEKSWDCPCHGSRFDHDGDILNGPASRPMQKDTQK